MKRKLNEDHASPRSGPSAPPVANIPFDPLSRRKITESDVKYDVSDFLGKGSFGRVYKGRLRGATRVAIKLLEPEAVLEAPDMFSNEVRVWIDLTGQKFVLPLLAYCESPPMMITEIASDGNLREYLIKQRWNWDISLRLLHQVAQGMAYLHSMRVLHLDLKPPNVLVDGGQARIADFGLSRIRSASSASSIGFTGGTPGYMAPEVYDGKGKEPADTFAFAMVAFEVATGGSRPFAGSNDVQIMSAICVRKSRPLKTERGDNVVVPNWLWNLIEQCWRHEAVSRPTFVEIDDEMEGRASGALQSSSGIDSELPTQKDPPAVSHIEHQIAVSDLHYDPEDFLGKGSIGKTYKGRLRGTIPVAIKLLNPDLLEDSKGLFTKEVRTWLGVEPLSHLNVLVAYCESAPVLVNKMASDGNMREYLDNLQWDWDVGLRLLQQLAQGMAYLHSTQMLHLNLKPPNVLVDAGQVKITDFGLSYVWGGKAVTGMIGYQAPEVSKGRGIKASDIFSFAMIAFEVVTGGRRPFAGMGDIQILGALMDKKRPTRAIRRNDHIEVPNWAWELIERCWTEDAKERPTFVDVYEELLQRLPELPSGPSSTLMLDSRQYGQPLLPAPRRSQHWVDQKDLQIDRRASLDKNSSFEVFNGKYRDEVDVAVYMVSETLLDDHNYGLFQNTMKIWAGLPMHENIAPLIGYRDRPALFLTKQYTPDSLLKEHLAQRHWDTGLALQLLLHVARALAFLHSNNVVHSNLKPGNIIVQMESGLPVAKLANLFWLQAQTWSDSSLTGSNSTYEGIQEVNLRFVPPEYFEDDPMDKPWDAWAFGMVCYFALSGGKKPYEEMKAKDIRIAVGKGERPPRPAGASE